MKTKIVMNKRIILVGIGIAALYWVLESVVMVLIFNEGNFVEQMFAPSAHEIWMRSVGIGTIFAFGLYGHAVLAGRKKAEVRLRESKAFAENLIISMKDGFSVLDNQGVHTNVNTALCQMTGFTQEELIGVGPPHPYWPEEEYEEIQKAFQKTLIGEFADFELIFKRKNGTRFPVIVSPSWLSDKQGNIVNYFATIKDISQRKLIEEELRRANAEYIATINMTGDIIVRLDNDGRRILVNDRARQFFGISHKEFLSGQIGDHLHPDDIASSFKAVDNMKKTGKPIYGLTNRQLTPFGTRIVEWNCYPFFDENGRFDGWQATGRDITERIRMENEIIQTRAKMEALRVSGKMKTEILFMVSHELRTPLASIKGFASTLLQPDVRWSEEEQRDFIQEIDRQADLLTRLVSDLLDMSYIDAGLLNLNEAEHKLDNVLESASDTLNKITENHKLKVKIPAELPPVLVDPGRITQVLINLIENAVKYSAQGSQITIEARLADDKVITTVTDKGIGIPSELLDKVFDRFYQAESITAGAKNGTGLGLSICRGIVKAHGGRLWVRSKKGHGSKFSFSLPLGKGKIVIT